MIFQSNVRNIFFFLFILVIWKISKLFFRRLGDSFFRNNKSLFKLARGTFIISFHADSIGKNGSWSFQFHLDGES